MTTFLINVLCLLCNLIDSQAQIIQSCYSHTQSLPEPIYGHMGVYSTTANSVYLFGGRGPGGSYINPVYKWNLNQTDSWFVSIGTAPTPRFYGYANNGLLIDDIVWFIGVDDDENDFTGNIYQFDTKTDSWLDTSHLESPPLATNHGCLSTNGTHIFMVDGYANLDSWRPIMQVYDIATNSWDWFHIFGASVRLDGGWRYQYCSMIENKLWIFGGKISGSTYDDDIDEYDVIQDMYSVKAGGLLPGAQAFGIAVYHDGLIYLVGSYPHTPNINIFDVETQQLSNMIYTTTKQISAAATLILDDKLWIFGGENGTLDAVSDVEICDLSS